MTPIKDWGFGGWMGAIYFVVITGISLNALYKHEWTPPPTSCEKKIEQIQAILN